MTEFQEVMRQGQRMCKRFKTCGHCPIYDAKLPCPFIDVTNDKNDVIERIIMGWATEHPEPRYPTWKEWQEATFPEARNQLCINHFASAECKGCAACRSKPIPADIAQKLGIQPITEERVDK